MAAIGGKLPPVGISTPKALPAAPKSTTSQSPSTGAAAASSTWAAKGTEVKGQVSALVTTVTSKLSQALDSARGEFSGPSATVTKKAADLSTNSKLTQLADPAKTQAAVSKEAASAAPSLTEYQQKLLESIADPAQRAMLTDQMARQQAQRRGETEQAVVNTVSDYLSLSHRALANLR